MKLQKKRAENMVSEIYFLINMLMIDEIRNEVNIEYIIDFEMYEKEKRKKIHQKSTFLELVLKS